MQIDPIKPMLKPPGTKHLKLKCDILHSTFAFNFYLRRYSKGARGEGGGGGDSAAAAAAAAAARKSGGGGAAGSKSAANPAPGLAAAARAAAARKNPDELRQRMDDIKVGRCRFTLSNLRRKQLELSG